MRREVMMGNGGGYVCVCVCVRVCCVDLEDGKTGLDCSLK